jgi:hypothetical protein
MIAAAIIGGVKNPVDRGRVQVSTIIDEILHFVSIVLRIIDVQNDTHTSLHQKISTYDTSTNIPTTIMTA